MELEVVNLAIAKQLKERGFSTPTEYYYLDRDLPFVDQGLKCTKNNEKINHNQYDEFIYSAPTFDQTVEWLKTQIINISNSNYGSTKKN